MYPAWCGSSPRPWTAWASICADAGMAASWFSPVLICRRPYVPRPKTAWSGHYLLPARPAGRDHSRTFPDNRILGHHPERSVFPRRVARRGPPSAYNQEGFFHRTINAELWARDQQHCGHRSGPDRLLSLTIPDALPTRSRRSHPVGSLPPCQPPPFSDRFQGAAASHLWEVLFPLYACDGFQKAFRHDPPWVQGVRMRQRLFGNILQHRHSAVSAQATAAPKRGH